MKAKKVKESAGSRIFDVINIILLAGVAFICMAPFLFVISASVSPLGDVLSRRFFIYPKHIDLSSYQYLFSSNTLIRAMGNSFVITFVGTVLSMTVTVMTAYVLSKPQLLGRKVLNAMVVFTMLFSGGMIPGYLLIKGLGLIDNRWALVLPGLISAYNVIIMKSFFMTIPESLEESAKIDGATEVTIFWKIVLPLSKATIATIALFTAVGYWNDYFSSVLYINTKSRWALQAVLRYMLTNTNQAMQSAGVTVASATNVTAATIKSASVVIATVPILCVYPFVQKYFVKGVMIGGVKG